MIDPVLYGKPLRKTLKGYFKLRISDYRLVYTVKKKIVTVLIVAIAHRKEIYKKLK